MSYLEYSLPTKLWMEDNLPRKEVFPKTVDYPRYQTRPKVPNSTQNDSWSWLTLALGCSGSALRLGLTLGIWDFGLTFDFRLTLGSWFELTLGWVDIDFFVGVIGTLGSLSVLGKPPEKCTKFWKVAKSWEPARHYRHFVRNLRLAFRVFSLRLILFLECRRHSLWLVANKSWDCDIKAKR